MTLRHYGESTVSNLAFRTTAALAGGTGIYHVYGRFLPASDCFHNVEMLDGSTIDLSGKTGAWNSTYSRTTSNGSCNCFVTFKSGGTMAVDLTGREAEVASLANGEVAGNESGYVITWAAKPADVKFVPKMADAEKYVFYQNDAGLRIARRKGLLIVVK